MAFTNRTLRSILVIGSLDLIVVFCWVFIRNHGVTRLSSNHGHSILRAFHLQGEPTCPIQRHVAFVKVEKAGSSTVQNVIYRFGTTRNLTFVLPKYGNYISYSTFVRDRDVMPLPLFADKFDITCNHVKYNRTAFKKFLPPDTSYVGIIRHPLSLINSYIYYFLSSIVPGKNKLTEFLEHPRYYVSKTDRDVSFNLISNYFGLPKESNNRTEIELFIETLDKEFDLIMVLELLDESLLLMKRMFCWNISDILYVKQNAYYDTKPSEDNTTVLTKNKHRQLADADYALYRYFYKKIQDKVFKQGADFRDELSFYRQAKAAVSKYCTRQLWRVDGPLRIQETVWEKEIIVTSDTCQMIMMSELEFLNLVGIHQYGKIWKELHRKNFYQ